jgi:hypothetical protein
MEQPINTQTVVEPETYTIPYWKIIGIMYLIGLIIFIIGIITTAISRPNPPIYAWVLFGTGLAILFIAFFMTLYRLF